MGFGEMVVAIVLIGTVAKIMEARNRSGGSPRQIDMLIQEVRELKSEIRELRRQNNDVVLGLDTTVHQVERRLQTLETKAMESGRTTVLPGR